MNIDETNMSLADAQNVMDSFAAVNLDEILPERLKVAFREFKPGPDGKSVVIETTVKEINTWVPMYLFNAMLSNQKKVQKLRKQRALQSEFRVEEQEQEEFDLLEEPDLDFAQITDAAFKAILANTEPTLLWQAREVLTVWKLTPGEAEMSLKRLMLGLTFEQIQGLFMRFFGAMLRQKQSRA